MFNLYKLTAFRSVFIACVFSITFLSGAASQAEGRCTSIPSYGDPRNYTIESYFDSNPVRGFHSVFPVQRLETFFKGNCNDENFLKAIAQGYSDRLLQLRLSEKNDLFARSSPWEPGYAFKKGVEMYFLGHDDLLKKVLSTYTELRNDGNPAAATVLAGLGGFTSIYALNFRAQRIKEWAARLAPSVYASRIFAIGETNLPSEDHFFSPSEDIQLAIDADYAPGIAIYLSSSSPSNVNFCNSIDGSVAQARSRLVEVGTERFASAAAIFALQTIKSNNRSGDFTGAVQKMNLFAANALTECEFEYAAPQFVQATVVDDRAHDLIHLAAHAWAKTKPDIGTVLALAYSIQENAEDEGAYYAATRLFVNALAARMARSSGRSLFAESYDFWIGKMSRQTIIEAQKLLAEYGLYSAGIDGIAGRGFRAGIYEIEYKCWRDSSTYPNLCIPSSSSKEIRMASVTAQVVGFRPSEDWA